MTRAIFLALLLGGCASWELLPESGAPPRPMPADVNIVVVAIPRSEIGSTETVGLASVPRDRVTVPEGAGGLLGYAVANTGAGGKWCRVVIAEELTGVQRERVLAHEKRHCTGQMHVIRNGVIVWLP
jgi:hypothetical protein